MEKKTLMENLMRYTKVMRFSVLVMSACITLRKFFRCGFESKDTIYGELQLQILGRSDALDRPKATERLGAAHGHA